MKPIIGKASITLGAITVAPAKPPYTYLGVAQNLMPAIKLLATTSVATSLALTILSAHVLECLLKAHLSRDGSDERLKVKGARHNLALLWSMASNEGLQISVTPPSWVDQLSHLHDRPYYMRYSTDVHGMVLPSTEPMTSYLEELMEIVREQLK